MYVNVKNETCRNGIEENDGGGEFNYDILIYYKNFCKSHNVPPPSTTTTTKL
jgi:hypothetical protein